MDDQSIPVSAPIDSDSAGKGGESATQSVVRLVNPAANTTGTGFLHKSGCIITAEHVIRNSPIVGVMLPNKVQLTAAVRAVDPDLDLALLEPHSPVVAPPLEISTANNLAIGAHVSTWGFPAGYPGIVPLLSVGYLSGKSAQRMASGVVTRWVVNAAFNGGNSGGPLIHLETGQVIGVVSSKLAPLSLTSQSILSALEGQKSGFTYTMTKPDGSTETFSEGRLVGMVLNELRQQVQLVIGMAVLLDDLRVFLAKAGV